ncbi:MAG: ribosomal L7Ae/L30e/S12e/Gadd45 family protein [Defluviitaleaceae bacterium]|nr:ribosomal L7Ae/L30e/S12e/Gadd45 family protein [Defluviitaleaceae bacterium]
MLSLSQRAGKLAVGERGCEMALQNGEAVLVIIAGDASGNTKKKFEQKAFYYETKCLELGTKTDIGSAIGKEGAAVVALKDLGMAEQIMLLECQETKTEVGGCQK